MARSERAEMAGLEIFEGQHCHGFKDSALRIRIDDSA
jgi:hypothetical protein